MGDRVRWTPEKYRFMWKSLFLWAGPQEEWEHKTSPGDKGGKSFKEFREDTAQYMRTLWPEDPFDGSRLWSQIAWGITHQNTSSVKPSQRGCLETNRYYALESGVITQNFVNSLSYYDALSLEKDRKILNKVSDLVLEREEYR